MGTEEFWVPAVMAAVSAGGNAVNQRNANQRADQDEAQAIRNQANFADQANSKVRSQINQIKASDTTPIANKATGDYVAQLRKNAAGATQGASTTSGDQTFGASTSALAPSTVGSKRYQSDAAGAQKQTQDYGNTYAGEMGNLDAATRMRTNEGLSMETLATGLNQLNSASWGKNFVDQLRAKQDSQANPWVSLFSNMLGGAAKSYATNAVPGASSYGKIPAGGTGIMSDSGLAPSGGSMVA